MYIIKVYYIKKVIILNLETIYYFVYLKLLQEKIWLFNLLIKVQKFFA